MIHQPVPADSITPLVESIQRMAERLPARPRIMEVCGTHTVAIFRHGLRSLLGDSVELVSGPGCPVCVTPNSLIDLAIAYAKQGYTVASFGDMLRVPGTESSLFQVRAEGADIQVVTSPLAAVDWAEAHPDRQVVFFGVGFETTVPGSGLLIEAAAARGLTNIYVLCAHKLIPPAMVAILAEEDQRISGFLCPGHVAAITGLTPFQRIASQYHIPCVVAGFEPVDILLSIALILKQLTDQEPDAVIEYRSVVRPEGNPKALALIDRIFEPADTPWRGFDLIPASGLRIKERYADFDAERRLSVKAPPSRSSTGCLCGNVLRGIIRPWDCPQFAKACSPDRPLGPCMVSAEGTCATYYMFKERR